MSAPKPEKGAVRAELGVALDEQIHRLDRLLTRIWQLLAGLGILSALLLAAVQPGPLGLNMAAVCGFFFAWFTVMAAVLDRGNAPRFVVFCGLLAEGLVPWVFLIVLEATYGAAYAVGSWVPPLLVGVLILTTTVRLRPLAPLVLGVASGAFYLTLYFVLLRPRIPTDLEPRPLYTATMQVTRSLSLAVGGVIASLVTRALRDTIGRAERAVREQELFGKYRIEARIAAGGMGIVHRATYCPEGGFERTVAVKLLHPHLAEQPAFLGAFRAEAELSARLVHPNIVQVLDFGRVGQAYFLAMEFVDGLTLGSFIRRTLARRAVLTPGVVAWLGREILAGLHHSHAAARDSNGALLRVVHRDLCPANVLLSKSGEVKIADFGIARALRDAETSHTRTVAGHLGYMAPEQARAGPLDERCDLFSAAVILWELLTMQQLFHRGAEAPTLLALLSGEVPPLAELRPDLDPGWETFLRRGLASDRNDRFASAREMLSALDAVSGGVAKNQAEELASLVGLALAIADPGSAQEPANEAGDASESEAPTRLEPRGSNAQLPS